MNAFERLYAELGRNDAFNKLVAIMVDHARDVASHYEDPEGIDVSLGEVIVTHVRAEVKRTA